ncbi:MAG: GNAT family N-acetyltransferase, partial [Sporomusa sp.]
MDNSYTVVFAKHEDIKNWMDLVDVVKDDFPGLIIEDYQKMLERAIDLQVAICVKYNKLIIGVLIFSLELKCLACMAVHPQHRNHGAASAMIEKMLHLFPDNTDIWVSTYRADDKKGIAPRALYKKFGFT